jgi:hypothetical protein
MDRAIGKSHAGEAFSFSPTAATVDSSQPRNLANSRPGGESFDVGNFTENLETRDPILPSPSGEVNSGALGANSV